MIADIAQERRFAAQQRRRDVRPRIKRDRKYALVRAWGTVVQTDLQVQAVIADLYAGRPVGYSTFLAYDEVAHHSGVERADALAVLRRVDRQIGAHRRGRRKTRRGPTGSSSSPTTASRRARPSSTATAMSLEDLVRRGLRGRRRARPRHANSNEALELPQRVADRGLGPRLRAAAGPSAPRREAGGWTARCGWARTGSDAGPAEELPELSVMASGCLGLITFPREPGRVTLERIEAALAAAHPGAARAPGDRLPARALGGATARS